MIAIIALLVGVTIGISIGATIVRDALDGLWSWPRRREPELPRAWVESWAQLNAPTIRRRSMVIDAAWKEGAR